MQRISLSNALIIALAACFVAVACNKSSSPQSSPESTSVKHYQLKGKVVSIDKQGKMVNVDNETIPGFMGEMTMPYQVKPESELEKLHPGDTITGDLVVQDQNSWLQKIAITGNASAPVSK